MSLSFIILENDEYPNGTLCIRQCYVAFAATAGLDHI